MFPYSALLHIQSPSTIFSVDLTHLPLSPSKLDIFRVFVSLLVFLPPEINSDQFFRKLNTCHFTILFLVKKLILSNWIRYSICEYFNKNHNPLRILVEKNGLILWMRSKKHCVFWLCLWHLIQSLMSQPTLMLFFPSTNWQLHSIRQHNCLFVCVAVPFSNQCLWFTAVRSCYLNSNLQYRMRLFWLQMRLFSGKLLFCADKGLAKFGKICNRFDIYLNIYS